MIFNIFVKTILKSPLHGMMSKGTILIEYKGNKSGKAYSVPVNFMLDDGEFLVTSNLSRVWWKNLREKTPFSVYYAGSSYPAEAEVFEDVVSVFPALKQYLEVAPKNAKFFQVSLDDDGCLNEDDLKIASEDRAMLRIRRTG